MVCAAEIESPAGRHAFGRAVRETMSGKKAARSLRIYLLAALVAAG